MSFSRSDIVWDIVNICLVVILGWQLQENLASPSLLPILNESTEPRQLQAPNGLEHGLFYAVQQIGTPINTEDIIRELQHNPNLVQDSPRLKKHLHSLQALQQELLSSEERLLALEKELNHLSLRMLQELTPEQRNILFENRNRDAVQGIEQEYWEQLINGDTE